MLKNSPKVLVTGASGFIGRHLAEYLSHLGWNVHRLLREGSPVPPSTIPHGHDWLIRNGKDLPAVLGNLQPDLVFHLATYYVNDHRSTDVVPMLESNLVFGTQLIEAMLGAGCKSLVNTGTVFQHCDNAKYGPASLYAATKEAYAALLKYYTELKGLREITLKLSDTYGQQDSRKKLVPLLLDALREGKPLTMKSNGEDLINLTHVEDIARGFQLAAEKLLENRTVPSEEFFLRQASWIKLRDLVGVMEKVAGKKIPIQWSAQSASEPTAPVTYGKVLPGWNPRVSLESGFSDLIDGQKGKRAA